MAFAKNNSQINLKLPSKLICMAEEYADYYGYSNVQELIRESLREKVFNEEVREDYVKKLVENEKNNEWVGKKKSEELLLEMGKKAMERTPKKSHSF